MIKPPFNMADSYCNILSKYETLPMSVFFVSFFFFFINELKYTNMRCCRYCLHVCVYFLYLCSYFVCVFVTNIYCFFFIFDYNWSCLFCSLLRWAIFLCRLSLSLCIWLSIANVWMCLYAMFSKRCAMFYLSINLYQIW